MSRKRPISPPKSIAEPAAPLHPYDDAVTTQNPNAVAAEHKPEFLAVLRAFVQYEAGDDEAARQSLQAIGATSPFADWKLLLRGLIAFQGNDDARAVENWQRLSPTRLPIRLAAPFRMQCDAAFAELQPTAVKRLAAKYFGTPMLRSLLELIPLVHRDEPLADAFKLCEKLVPLMKIEKPEMLPRLAGVLYNSVARFGEPKDLVHYRKLFGAPADDPDFHRINALGYENESPAEGIKHWESYEKWLATHPPGWGPALIRVSRALVLRHVARVCMVGLMRQEVPESMMSMIEALMRRSGKGPVSLPKRTPLPQPLPFWQRAFALNPADPELTTDLMMELERLEDPDGAIAVARKHLEVCPDSPQVLDDLSGLFLEHGKIVAAYETFLAASRANPLDKKLRLKTAGLAHAAIRTLNGRGEPGEIEAMTALAADTQDSALVFFNHSLLAMLARKDKRHEDAARHEAALNAVPFSRVVAALVAHADATNFKLKPAEKKPFVDRQKEVLAGPATVAELGLADDLLAISDEYGIPFTSRGTTAKKIQTMLAAAVKTDLTLDERILIKMGKVMIAARRFETLDKVAAAMHDRFPMNPWFTIFLAECILGKAADSGRPPQWRKLDTWTGKTRRLMRNHPDMAWFERRLEKISDPDGPVEVDDYL